MFAWQTASRWLSVTNDVDPNNRPGSGTEADCRHTSHSPTLTRTFRSIHTQRRRWKLLTARQVPCAFIHIHVHCNYHILVPKPETTVILIFWRKIHSVAVVTRSKLSLTNRATHLCKRNSVAGPKGTRPSPHVLPFRIWSLYVKRYERIRYNYGDPTEIFNPSRSAVAQGHSRSSEPTQIDRLPSCDFLLSFHSIYRHKLRFQSKTANSPVYLTASLTGVPLGIG